jgi:polyisoprenyl-phosphate glycosyltransferase
MSEADTPPVWDTLAVVIPVLNDWASLRTLCGELDRLELPGIRELRLVVVDDGSTEPAPADLGAALGQGRIAAVSVVELSCNVGHQRAIALGLAHAVAAMPDAVLAVMDSDGEDNPADLPRLLAELDGRSRGIVVAGRSARSEGTTFRAGYAFYTRLFRLLVGRNIRFGNFSVVGPDAARRLVRMPETWNHFAAALLRSRLPVAMVPTRRAQRYAGQSTMNLPSLVAHGLSAFSVFSDHVFARLLMLGALIGGATLLASVVVIAMRFGTNLATPGWATTAVGLALVLFLQTVLVTLVAAVQMLATRSQAIAQPATLAPIFIHRVNLLPLGAG